MKPQSIKNQRLCCCRQLQAEYRWVLFCLSLLLSVYFLIVLSLFLLLFIYQFVSFLSVCMRVLSYFCWFSLLFCFFSLISAFCPSLHLCLCSYSLCFLMNGELGCLFNIFLWKQKKRFYDLFAQTAQQESM